MIFTQFPTIQNSIITPDMAFLLQMLVQEEKNVLFQLENALNKNKQLILQNIISNKKEDLPKQTLPPSTEIDDMCKNIVQSIRDNNFKNHKQNSNRKTRLLRKKQNYDTKNIPKNFGTAIHIFIKKNSIKVKNLLSKNKISYSHFYQFNKDAKQKINSLLHLRQLWESKENAIDAKMRKCYRILSHEFMRRHCLSYIFGSRIKNINSHIRYRKKLLQGIERPHTLYNLKDY